MKLSHLSLLICSCLLCLSCAQSDISTTDNYIHIEGQRFVDAHQRTMICNGLNLVEKDPLKGYVQAEDESLFKQFRLWGVNCVRYGIHWDGLEPEPGQINETYLAEIDKRVRWAKENQIFLILDMHQDLYSRKFGNGAPLWATLDEGLPHATGAVWSDAYLMSPAVQKSFDNFWLNKPASDGIGIQDHYLNLWKTLAARYADSTSVMGFDVMNEPFIGSKAPAIFQQLIEGLGGYMAMVQHRVPTAEELISIWSDEKKRTEVLSLLDDSEVFRGILKHAEKEVRIFEENQLSSFYQKVRDAIRTTGSKQILFFEHNYFCNMGMESTFHFPITEEGKIDSLCAYAPHAYDLVVDTEGATRPGYKRLTTIFEQLSSSANHRNVPMLIGEWGAFYMGNNYSGPALHHLNWIEKELVGQTYWAWWPGIETQDYFNLVISRPYPQFTNGRLLDYQYDATNHLFQCSWQENNTSVPSRIYVPNLTNLSETDIRLNPTSSFKIIPLDEKSCAGYLEIDPINGKRELTLSLRKRIDQ